MAGEQLGRLYEAIVYHSLLATCGPSGTHISWDEDVVGLSKRPDFVVGHDLSKPEAIVLVTHSISAKNSSFKYWRSVCEVVDAKTSLSPSPTVINVVFDAAIKPDIMRLSNYTFDATICVNDFRDGQALIEWARQIAVKLPHGKAAQAEFVNKKVGSLKSTSPEARVLRELAKTLSESLAMDRKTRATVAARKRGAPRAAIARTTALRRGIAKALLFDDIGDIWAGPAELRKKTLPSFYFQLHLFAQSIGGPVVCDRDLLWLRQRVPSERTFALVASAPKSQMGVWLDPLKNLSALEVQREYVKANWKDLTTSQGLLRHLLITSQQAFVASMFDNAAVPPGWLFEYLRELAKAYAGKKTAWGWSVLIQDLKSVDSEAAYRGFVARESGLSVNELESDWSGYRTVTYSIPEWVMGDSRSNFPLRKTDLPRLSYVFSPYVARIPQGRLDALHEAVIAFYIANYLEAKLVQYRNFDPLGDLIRTTLTAAHVSHSVVERFPSAFVDRALLAGEHLNARAGRTELIVAGSSLIGWQTISQQGRDHKAKELVGRAFAVSHTWSGRRFEPRSSVAKLCLVLDGEVDQPTIDAVQRGGWDIVLYPDEMEYLVEAIA